MSFFKSLKAAIIANLIRDSKKEDERLAEWNRLFHIAQDMQMEFSDFLYDIGVNDSYIVQVSKLADEGITAINEEKFKLEHFKKKINEFIALGGHKENIWYVEKIDEYVAKLKYLISIERLDEQDDWLQRDLVTLKSTLTKIIEAENKEKKMAEIENEKINKQIETIMKSIDFDMDITLISIEDEINTITVLDQCFDYSSLNNMLLQNSHNYSVRARMIDLLIHVFLWDSRDYFVYDEVDYVRIPITKEKYKICVAKLIREQIMWFNKFADKNDPKIQIVNDFYYVYLAEIELVSGHLNNAYRLFDIALRSKTLKEASDECKIDESSVNWCTNSDSIYMIIVNMCQILSLLGLKNALKELLKKYTPLIQYEQNISNDIYKMDPDSNYTKLRRNLSHNLHIPVAFLLHDYDEYLEDNSIDKNLYDSSVYGDYLTDSAFTTYLLLKKVTISNYKVHISSFINPKITYVELDLLEIINRDKKELENYLLSSGLIVNIDV